jgi:hypothetical protein
MTGATQLMSLSTSSASTIYAASYSTSAYSAPPRLHHRLAC